MKEIFRLGTRGSPLALAQAELAKIAFENFYPNKTVKIVPIITTGDRYLKGRIADIGGKGLFIKEIEEALRRDEIDFAAHSMKDVETRIHTDFIFPALLERASPQDVLVSASGQKLTELPVGTVIGTASLRRSSLIAFHYPHLKTQVIRGNIQTRLDKLAAGEIDALILAESGLMRLNLNHLITERICINTIVPSAGQGAIGLQCRTTNQSLMRLLTPLNHHDTNETVNLERAFLDEVDGTCGTPVGSYALLKDNKIYFSGVAAEPRGASILQKNLSVNRQDAEAEIRLIGQEMNRWLKNHHVL